MGESVAIGNESMASDKVEPWLTSLHGFMGAMGFVAGLLGYARDLEKSGKRGRIIIALSRGCAGAIVCMIVGGVALSYGVTPFTALGIGGGFASAGMEVMGRVADWLLGRIEMLLTAATSRIIPQQPPKDQPPQSPPKSQDR